MPADFKPAIKFVSVFVVAYFIGNLVYGFYIQSHGNTPDFFTESVAHQTTIILNLFNCNVENVPHKTLPSVNLLHQKKVILNIFEGCNGVNVIIVFVSFLLAFGGPRKRMIYFILLGLFSIHIVNLGRIILLYWVAIDFQKYFYFVHKFFFTAVLYGFVFVLWYVWVKLRISESKTP